MASAGRLERLLGSKLGSDLNEYETDGLDAVSRLCIFRFLAGKLAFDLEEFDNRKAIRAARTDTSGRVEKNIYLWEPKSLSITAINWWHVLSALYFRHAFRALILVAVGLIAYQISIGKTVVTRAGVLSLLDDYVLLEAMVMVSLIMLYFGRAKASVYCLENSVFVPPESWRVTQEELITMMKAQDCFTQESLDFMNRVLERSGTGDSTAWPPSILPSKDGQTKAPKDIKSAREEAKAVIFPLVREVLERADIKPEAIDFLIINCSLFAPTPSLCAMVCNEFCLREDVRSYNLGGMGCSANGISVDLAKQLLQNQPGSRALVISTENLTQNLYNGNSKGMLLQNTLFRCGGCALLLSSRFTDSVRAKYKLLYTFRAQVSEDSSYDCVYQQADNDGNLGVSLSKDIVNVAGRAIKRNFIMLGPYVLPMREQLKVLFNRVHSRLISHAKKSGWPMAKQLAVPAGYTPNFGKGIDHFCIHAGGRAVIEGVQKNLGLSDKQAKPSLQTLHDFGNTSSSSIWYEMDWVERHGGLQRGDRVLQLAFGSGFKCNSNVWVALRVDRSKVGVSVKAAAA